jgi:hypothetical protein
MGTSCSFLLSVLGVRQSGFQQSLLDPRQQFVEHQTNSCVTDLLVLGSEQVLSDNAQAVRQKTLRRGETPPAQKRSLLQPPLQVSKPAPAHGTYATGVRQIK